MDFALIPHEFKMIITFKGKYQWQLPTNEILLNYVHYKNSNGETNQAILFFFYKWLSLHLIINLGTASWTRGKER